MAAGSTPKRCGHAPSRRAWSHADAQLTEAEIFSLILQPGFSTAEGHRCLRPRRGHGRGAAQRGQPCAERIDIASKPGDGTSVTLRLPLTLAIIDGLLVRVGEAYFVLPLATTLECIELTRQDIEKRQRQTRGQRARRDHSLHPAAASTSTCTTAPPEREQIMVAETEDGRYGFVVDQVLGDHQTVIKNLGRFYRHVQVVSGATILGNGTVALILDPHRLVQDAIRAIVRASAGTPCRHSAGQRSAERHDDGLQLNSSQSSPSDGKISAIVNNVSNDEHSTSRIAERSQRHRSQIEREARDVSEQFR